MSNIEFNAKLVEPEKETGKRAQKETGKRARLPDRSGSPDGVSVKRTKVLGQGDAPDGMLSLNM